MRRFLLSFVLFVAVPLGAQGAGDYVVGLSREPDTQLVPIHGRVTFLGWPGKPGEPENWKEVVLELDVPGDDVQIAPNCTGTKPIRCTLKPEDDVVKVSAVMNHTGTFTATARVIAPNDPNLANNQTSLTFEVVDRPSLMVQLYAGFYDPNREGDIWLGIVNFGAVATDIVLTLTLPEGGTFTGKIKPADTPITCTPSGQTMVCTAASLGNPGVIPFVAEVMLPDRLDGGTIPVHATVTSSGNELDPSDNSRTATITFIPQILVTNTNDEGSGSLRQALLDARQRCAEERCTINFRIPGDGHIVIRPRSELPEVLGLVKIDGSTQTRFGGDWNPSGPDLVLDGSLTTAPTRGLVLGGPSCEMSVFDLAIVNFPSPGIEVRRGDFDFRNCSGYFAGHTVLERNHLTSNYRGIALVGLGYAAIRDNLIANNQRAGIFGDGFTFVEIVRNRISANGASGIFLNPADPYQLRSGHIEENEIFTNAEWGIARVPKGDVLIRRNSIYANRYPGIDVGLDFETPNRADDPHWEPGVPNKPVLLSTSYDPFTNTTRVFGRLDSNGRSASDSFTIDVYVSTSLSDEGHPQAQYWAGSVVLPRDGGHADFVLDISGNLRGQYLTATNTRRHLMYWDDHVWDTSELSRPLLVQ